jgi:hypothetical protein
MKCPKCKEEMIVNKLKGLGSYNIHLCENKECEYYGIERNEILNIKNRR